ENATKVADMLTRHPRVTSVLYPGLPDHPGHEVAAKQMRSFGGMLSFRVEGGEEAAVEVCNRARVFTLGESLGGVESLIEHPGRMTHASVVGSALGPRRPGAPVGRHRERGRPAGGPPAGPRHVAGPGTERRVTSPSGVESSPTAAPPRAARSAPTPGTPPTPRTAAPTARAGRRPGAAADAARGAPRPRGSRAVPEAVCAPASAARPPRGGRGSSRPPAAGPGRSRRGGHDGTAVTPPTAAGGAAGRRSRVAVARTHSTRTRSEDSPSSA